MSSPFVTVLIDTYNYGHYIEDAVQSVLTQDFPRSEMEILIVDDGSTDDTSERVRKFGTNVRYLYKKNRGQASAFNFGFQHSRGEIVALLDADDVWLPNKLKLVLEQFQRNPDAALVYHPFLEWDEKSGLCQKGFFSAVSGNVLKSRAALLSYGMSGTGTFRRNALKALLPIPTDLRSQADAYLTALVVFVAPVVALPEHLMKYRCHGHNRFHFASGPDRRARIEHRIAMREVLFREISSWLRSHGYHLCSRDLRDYLKQWSRARAEDSFLLEPPSRWKYFVHLLDHPRTYGINMTVRHRFYSYLRSLAALFLGYDHLHVFDEVRMTYKRFCKRFFRRSVRDAGAVKMASLT